MSYHLQAVVSIIVLCFIHLFANRARYLGWVWHGRFLSFAGGVSFTYVFISLLPEVARGQAVINQAGIFPYFEKHVYLIALFGFLFFYATQSKNYTHFKDLSFISSMASTLLFNLLVGAAIADSNNPDVRPLALFTLAMGLHYFVKDHNLREAHKELYEHFGRWLLTIALVLGAAIGLLYPIPDPVAAIFVAFAAGGVLYNVMRYELPKSDNVAFFCFGSLTYAAILLSIGIRGYVHPF